MDVLQEILLYKVVTFTTEIGFVQLLLFLFLLLLLLLLSYPGM